MNSLNNTIKVGFDAKTCRLVMAVPFFLADVARSFPSRRFDARTKTWRMPLNKSNIKHLSDIRHRYAFQMDEAADVAIKDLDRLTAAPKLIPFPRHVYDFTRSKSGFAPMQHQDRMLDLAWGLKSCAWFAKMGTGKTFAAIHLAMARYIAGQIDAVMIICPSTLRRTWEKEFAKYATRKYDFRIHETKAPWMKEFSSGPSIDGLPVLAVSVEGLGISEASYQSVCQFLTGGRRVMTICDESSRIKNPDAKRTKRAIQLGAASEYRVILNGTPIALGVQDLWAQFEFLDPNIIGTGDYWAYKTRYLVMGGYEMRQIVGIQNMDELMNAIIPYTCEVGKEVLNLPPKVHVERPLEITPEQRRLMRIVIKGVDGTGGESVEIKVTNTLEKLLRCRQIVGGWLPKMVTRVKVVDGVEIPVYDTELVPLEKNPKLDALLEVIDDNFQGSKFIIWSTFRHEIEAIAAKLAGIYGKEAVECYYGDVEMSRRSEIEDRYCTDPKLRFFIGNPAAAGLGLTLVSDMNDVMIYYSGTNAYIDRAQSEDRAHRLGQTSSVTVVDLIAEKTVDEIIVASIRSKMDVEQFIIDRIKAGISLDEMLLGGVWTGPGRRGILTISPDASR